MRETKRFFNLKKLLIINSTLLIFASCSVQKKISKSANQLVLKDSSLLTAHVGISIYDPAANKYWYNYNGEKYFVPASNTKIPTCYAAMKYLGDSLKCFSFIENDTALFILPAGDPTFLHPGIESYNAYDFLKNTNKKIYLTDKNWKETALGSGWSWNDYNQNYMAERSPMPIYGNLIKWKQRKTNENPPYFIYSEPEISWKVNFSSDTSQVNFKVQRNLGENVFELIQGKERYKEINVPFVTNGIKATMELLSDTLGKSVYLLQENKATDFFNKANTSIKNIKTLRTNSMLTPMMHESDNFFAEQSLLMVSNERLGYMSDEKIIDTILKTDFKDLPQKPRWVDGSGLSRYNLFSPQDFVSILNKMEKEFGMDRIKVIFATGGTGTISNFYKADSTFIYAKTGTLSGVVALSGYLYTKKGKLLIFSTLVNNHQASATAVRRAVEKFIQSVRNNY